MIEEALELKKNGVQTNAIQQTQEEAAVRLEKVLIQGDLASLTSVERTAYYKRVCDSLGINPFTKPFEYIVLKGKTVLYATKGCTDQLRSVHNISVAISSAKREGDIFIVVARASNHLRSDEDTGVVSIKGLQGEDLANAIMKAHTKAKRRVTLSLCGLGWLDESEISSIPNATPVVVNHVTGEISESVNTETGEIPTPQLNKIDPELFEARENLLKLVQHPAIKKETREAVEDTIHTKELATVQFLTKKTQQVILAAEAELSVVLPPEETKFVKIADPYATPADIKKFNDLLKKHGWTTEEMVYLLHKFNVVPSERKFILKADFEALCNWLVEYHDIIKEEMALQNQPDPDSLKKVKSDNF